MPLNIGSPMLVPLQERLCDKVPENGTGVQVMWRKIMIFAATVAFVGAMAATTVADARMGGFGGGGFRGGGFHGAGFHGGGGFHAAGVGMRGGFVGGRSFV